MIEGIGLGYLPVSRAGSGTGCSGCCRLRGWHYRKGLHLERLQIYRIFFSFRPIHPRMEKKQVKANRFHLYISILYIFFLQNAGVF